ncbi:MAG: FAD-dependent oxidoreductase, partial [Candidatus Hermodarchaeota archaeon]
MSSKSSVLLCTCGTQLKLDYEFLESEIKKLDLAGSVTVHNLVCQDSGLEAIAKLLDENEARLVIAACTSQKIQPRIDLYLQSIGKDPSRITYVNIREHSAWVHTDISEASKKSLDMIRGALARSAGSISLVSETKEVPAHVTVIGGGIAGVEAALSLSNLGYHVTLVERESTIGGHVVQLPVVAPTGKSG